MILFHFWPREKGDKPYFQCFSLCFSFFSHVNPRKDCFLCASLNNMETAIHIRTIYHNIRVQPKEEDVFRPSNRLLTYNNAFLLLPKNFGYRNRHLFTKKANNYLRVANRVLLWKGIYGTLRSNQVLFAPQSIWRPLTVEGSILALFPVVLHLNPVFCKLYFLCYCLLT